MTLKVFLSYSSKDEEYKKELLEHLSLLGREGVLEIWHFRDIDAGTDFDNAIRRKLEQSEIFLLLLSSSFFASNYSYDIELPAAMRKHRAGQARVIPVILHPCDWQNSPLAKLSALPRDGKPISTFDNRHVAFDQVTQGLRKVSAELKSRQRITVCSSGFADEDSISAAIKRASPYSQITILPGVYNESVIVNKPLMIIGEDNSDGEKVVIRHDSESALVVESTSCFLENVTILGNKRAGENKAAIIINGGYVQISNCHFVSHSHLACVVEANASCEVTNSVFSSPNGLGILLLPDVSFSMNNCSVVDCHTGIYIASDGRIDIQNNVLDKLSRGVRIEKFLQLNFLDNSIVAEDVGILLAKDLFETEFVSRVVAENSIESTYDYAFVEE